MTNIFRIKTALLLAVIAAFSQQVTALVPLLESTTRATVDLVETPADLLSDASIVGADAVNTTTNLFDDAVSVPYGFVRTAGTLSETNLKKYCRANPMDPFRCEVQNLDD